MNAENKRIGQIRVSQILQSVPLCSYATSERQLNLDVLHPFCFQPFDFISRLGGGSEIVLIPPGHSTRGWVPAVVQVVLKAPESLALRVQRGSLSVLSARSADHQEERALRRRECSTAGRQRSSRLVRAPVCSPAEPIRREPSHAARDTRFVHSLRAARRR